VDESTKRLIRTAIDDLGDPPGAWAWVGLGSQARHEQSLSTDQDHALIYDAPERAGGEVDAYFSTVAHRVTDGLAAAGIPRCRGGVMAESPSWRADRSRWLQTYREQLASVEADGTVFSSIALDHRRIAGGLDVEPDIDAVVRDVVRGGRLVRRLASAALALAPPTGFFRGSVLRSGGSRDGTFDVKHGGITPITNVARAVAVASGSSAIRTLDRLRDASRTDIIDADLADGLEEAFRLLWRIRLRHQADRLVAGLPPDDAVDPRRLGPLTRRGLKEGFRLIVAAQRLLATEHGLTRR
jgi:CBS domain-containing protein